MQSLQLILVRGSPQGIWLLEWDESRFTLTSPSGQKVIDTETRRARWLLDFHALYGKGRVSFPLPSGTTTFKPLGATTTGLRLMMEYGIRTDPEYRQYLKGGVWWTLGAGVVMSLVAGSLFAGGIWFLIEYAGPDAPWLNAVRWFIRISFIVLLGGTLGGLGLCCQAVGEWWRIGRIERAADSAAPGDSV